jgi:hypothetical protein
MQLAGAECGFANLAEHPAKIVRHLDKHPRVLWAGAPHAPGHHPNLQMQKWIRMKEEKYRHVDPVAKPGG